MCHTGLLTAYEQDQDGTSSASSVLILLVGCQQTCMTYTIALCTVKNSWRCTEECPKYVEFYSKNKFEKLVHLVDFIIRIYHDARSPERQICSINVFTWLSVVSFHNVWHTSAVDISESLHFLLVYERYYVIIGIKRVADWSYFILRCSVWPW